MNSTLFITLLLAPAVVVWLFWMRLVFQNMKLVRELVGRDVLPADYSRFRLAFGKYNELDPRLESIHRRAKRLVLAFFLAGIWAFVGSAVIGYLLRDNGAA